jgi:hypothetical protein
MEVQEKAANDDEDEDEDEDEEEEDEDEEDEEEKDKEEEDDVATQDRLFPHYVPNSSIKHSKSDSKDRSQEIL